MTSSLHNRKMSISLKRKKIFQKKKTPFFCILKGLSNKHKKNFHFIGTLKCYAFPPFSLLTQVLAKIRNDKALVLFIAPVWTTQNWYPLLLQLAVEQPILLPRKDNLLTLPQSQDMVWLVRAKEIDLLQASVDEVVNLLSQSFAEGKSYSTVNTYRSALSSTLYPVNNVAVGSHSLVVRLLKVPLTPNFFFLCSKRIQNLVKIKKRIV